MSHLSPCRLQRFFLLVAIVLLSWQSVWAQVPVVNSFSPTSGPAGTVVTIVGSNFDTTAANNFVHFGNVRATVTVATRDTLRVAVPIGSSHQRIGVTVNGLTGYTLLPFATTFTGASLISNYFSLPQSMLPNTFFTYPFTMSDFSSDGRPEIMGVGSLGELVYSVNTSAPGNLSFGLPNTTAPQSGFIAPVIADLIVDGRLDLASLSFGGTPLRIHRNLSSGPGSLSIGGYAGIVTLSNPSALAAGDVDGDGKADLAIGYNGNNNVSFFRNNGTSASMSPVFDTRFDFGVGFTVGNLVLTDMDADGRADLLAVNLSTGTLSIFRSTSTAGTISFAPRINVTISSFARVITADLDSDGYPEVLTFATSNNLFKNNSTTGNISMASPLTVAMSTAPSSLAVDDVDGDGQPDIVSASLQSTGISIFKNTSNGGAFSFATAVTYPSVASPGVLYIRDVDRDGLPDVVVSSSQQPFVLRNNFNSPPVITSFSPAQATMGDTVTINGRNFTGATVVGFGGSPFASFTVVSDGIIKAVPGIGTGGDIAVTTPYGTATRPGFGYTMSPIISSISPQIGPVGSTVTIVGNHFHPIADSNWVNLGSIRATVVSANVDTIRVLVPSGAPSQRFSVTTRRRTAFSPRVFHTTFAGAGPVFDNTYFDTTQRLTLPDPVFTGIYGLGQGDLDIDGRPDLMIGTYIGSNGNQELYTLRNTSVGPNLLFGPLTQVPNIRPDFNDYDQPIADLNGDGKVDLVISGFDGTIPQPGLQNVGSIWRNNSTPGFIRFSNVFSVLNNSINDNEFYTADLDGDGRVDVVAKSYVTNSVSLLRNTTRNDTVSFMPALTLTIPTPSGASNMGGQVVLQDFDNDGRMDVAVARNQRVFIYRNTASLGSMAFASPVTFLFNGGPVGSADDICVADDLDGDGKIDIAMANPIRTSVSILRNNGSSGNIAFDAPQNFVIGQTPSNGVILNDLDGDGKPDIFINGVSRGVILKNNSAAGALAFAAPVNYPSRPGVNGSNIVAVADWDKDGKPDIITTSTLDRRLLLLRNTIGEPVRLVLCPPAGNGSIASNITATTYQWQVDTGSGFVDIANNAFYSNTNGPVLQLINIPSAWYGYRYRCVTDVGNSYPVEMRFGNTWTGAVSTAWENPANWSCGTLPDANTDVVVNTGNIVISSNVVVRSLRVNPGANISVAAGFTLTILQ
jgi:large repetitive protein